VCVSSSSKQQHLSNSLFLFYILRTSTGCYQLGHPLFLCYFGNTLASTNTIKDELSVIFVSLEIMVYPVILRVNLPIRDLSGGPLTCALQGQRYMSFELRFGM
jgi:hypothetical protein